MAVKTQEQETAVVVTLGAALLQLGMYISFPLQLLALSLSPRPLVIWHGLGDSYNSTGMANFQSMVKQVHPGMFVHSVYIHENQESDKRAGFVCRLFSSRFEIDSGQTIYSMGM